MFGIRVNLQFQFPNMITQRLDICYRNIHTTFLSDQCSEFGALHRLWYKRVLLRNATRQVITCYS